MEIVTVTNQKGGCGKTTTVWSLGVGLNKRGYRVLLVDLDAQSNLSFTANVDLLNLKTSLYDVFKGNASVNDALIQLNEGLYILVGSIDLASADREFTQLGRERMLKKALSQLETEFDYVLVDTPPTLGVMNENALTVCNKVIIPVQPEVYALQGTTQLCGFIDDIREDINPDLKIFGILITVADERTNTYKEMRKQFENVADMLGTKVFNTYIRRAVSVREVALQRSNIFDETPNATATIDYNHFIDEFLRG